MIIVVVSRSGNALGGLPANPKVGGMRSATDLQQSDILVGLTAPFLNDEQRVETLFLSTLSRYPREEERKKFIAYVVAKGTKRQKGEALGALRD